MSFTSRRKGTHACLNAACAPARSANVHAGHSGQAAEMKLNKNGSDRNPIILQPSLDLVIFSSLR
ncbi:hypothetical protein WQ57_21810 [Mesobacillus campisalis]|uniref:Uncharacterized protein n=1 Tax=Mesobacillus campisalis TaxID=1408103 RepID=A0A0M2SQP6_9BACI|nr:hypothetical protein WQ57_21810 [Mesobacillus campisalis]